MFASSAVFNWNAPVPQPFTRSDGPTFWPTDRRYRPLDYAFRRVRDLAFLTRALPPELTDTLKARFKPARGALTWETPPALPTFIRRPYEQNELRDGTEQRVCAETTLTAEFIERLLNAPEGMVTGLTHNFLLAMQIVRLRQLWEEVQRRTWDEAPLTVFARALG